MTYTNENLGISLRYPSYLYVSASPISVDFSFIPIPSEPAPIPLDGFSIDKRDQHFSKEFDALFNATVGADVPEAHHAVYVKIEKLRNFKINGYDAVEYKKDGITPIPSNPEYGRGPVGYSRIIIIKKNENEFFQYVNTSMDIEKVNERNQLFHELLNSLQID